MAKAVSERSLLVLDFLKENADKNMTAADIGEALGLEKKSVDGIVTSGLCRKGLAERIPAEIELTNENGDILCFQVSDSTNTINVLVNENDKILTNENGDILCLDVYDMVLVNEDNKILVNENNKILKL